MSAATVTHRTVPGSTVVTIAGDLDFVSAGRVTDDIERVLAEPLDRLVVDLSPTTFLDSAGIKLLYELHSAMSARAVDVRVVVPPHSLIHRTLEVTGADRTLTIHPSLDDAIATG